MLVTAQMEDVLQHINTNLALTERLKQGNCFSPLIKPSTNSRSIRVVMFINHCVLFVPHAWVFNFKLIKNLIRNYLIHTVSQGVLYRKLVLFHIILLHVIPSCILYPQILSSLRGNFLCVIPYSELFPLKVISYTGCEHYGVNNMANI